MLGSMLIVFGAFALIFLGVVGFDLIKAKANGTQYNMRTSFVAYGLLIPAVILGFIFVLLPIIYSLGYAFTDYDFFDPEGMTFVWFDQFKLIFEEFARKGDIFLSLINTLKFVVVVVPLQIGLALALALFVNNERKCVGLFKVCFFAPVAISLAVTSYLWKSIMSPSETGLMNLILGVFNIPPQSYIEDVNNAMYWIAILSAWQGCGYQMLIFLSGLSNVRKELYEAASLDGAGSFRQFLHITIPGLRSISVYVIITVFIGACRVMIQPYLMSGYYSHTMTLSLYMYTYGTRYHLVGYSSAVALLMTIVIGLITYLQRRFLTEKD
ncbi:MAG: sugar ABC transporter permease [Clostridiales bacterium]|nr:sugar ABC transporter permease [Clostridiales bacterium]